MANSPTVSVIIPAYNVGRYIAQTLESLFSQTYKDFEAIVINDGSTDDTEKNIAPFLSRINYLKQVNSGVMAARNAGLRVAKGDYIALLDGDDVWMPRFLESLVGILESDPAISVAYPNAVFRGATKFDGKLYQDVFPVSEPVTFDRVLRRECYIFGSLVMRREAVEAMNGFDESLEGQGAEDFDLWLRMLLNDHRFKFTDEVLVAYRRRQESLSGTGVSQLKCLISVYHKLSREEKTTPEQRQWISGQMVALQAQLGMALFRDYLGKGDYPSALAQLDAVSKNNKTTVKLRIMRALFIASPSLLRWWLCPGTR